MNDPTVLTREQLLPVLVCMLRRQQHAAEHAPLLMPPLPPCPGCSLEPTEVIDLVDRTIGRPVRLHFRPCGHEFTASDQDFLDVWDTASSLVAQQQNRPAGERVHAPCPQVRSRERHDAHDWFAPVDGRARCPGYDAAEPDLDGGRAEPAPPQTDAEKVRDLEHILQRVRETVDTDAVLVGCEEHDARIAELEYACKEHVAAWKAANVELRDALGLDNDEAIDALGAARDMARELGRAREDRDDARSWARHGYEIGQRHCGWTDHGVAPAWLTEGWPASFDTCEGAARAAEYDTLLTRVRTIASTRLDEDECSPQERHGYHDAMRAVAALLNEGQKERTLAYPDGEGE